MEDGYMLRTIRLYGSLADELGTDSFNLDVDTPAMLVRGLEYVVPQFKKVIRSFTNIGFVCTKNNGEKKDIIKSTDFHLPFDDADTIHVVPRTEGNAETIFWAVAEFVSYYVADETVGLIIAGAITAVIVVGSSMALSAIAQSLAPKPSSSGQNDTSFIFSGPQNTVKQGGPLPIIYGTCLVGSAIVASNYETLDIPVGSTANTFINPGSGR
jgi:predicted phage tail protein